MDNFHKAWIYGALIALITGCVGCASSGKKSTDLVDEMADNCEHGLKRAEVKEDDDDKTVKIECADPPRYGL